MDTLNPKQINIVGAKPQQQKTSSNPIEDKLAELHKRYDDIMTDMSKIINKYRCSPIEIYRIGSEIHAIGLDRLANNIDVVIDSVIDDKLNKRENKKEDNEEDNK